MSRLSEPNEEIDEETELVATNHRDRSEEAVPAQEEEAIQTPHEDPREALEELGEDVASSPARRAHDDPQEAAEN